VPLRSASPRGCRSWPSARSGMSSTQTSRPTLGGHIQGASWLTKPEAFQALLLASGPDHAMLGFDSPAVLAIIVIVIHAPMFWRVFRRVRIVRLHLGHIHPSFSGHGQDSFLLALLFSGVVLARSLVNLGLRNCDQFLRESRKTLHWRLWPGRVLWDLHLRLLPLGSCRASTSRRARLRQFLPDERLVGEPLANNRLGDLDETPSVVVGAVVVAKGLFIEVAEQMERHHADVGAFDGALKQRPEVVEAVDVDLALDVFLAVVDHAVNVVVLQALVGQERVGKDFGARLHVLAHLGLEPSLASIRDDAKANGAVLSAFAVVFHKAHDRDLAHAASALDHPLAAVLVHETRFAADECFIHFSRAAELIEGLGLHREPNPVQHKPSGLLGNTEPPRYCVGADTVLAVDQHPNAGEPLVEADGAVLKHGPDLDGELLPATLALPDAPGAQERRLSGAAMRTGRAVRPAQPSEEGKGHIGVREVADRVNQGLGASVLGVHVQKYSSEAWVSQVYYCLFCVRRSGGAGPQIPANYR